MCACRKVEYKLSVWFKTKISSCIPKNTLKLCTCIWTSMAWPRAPESTLPFKIASYNCRETAQLSKMFCDDSPLTVQEFGFNIVSPKFPSALSFLNLLGLFPFLESIHFFLYDFKNIEHLITLVNSNAASRQPVIIFVALMISPLANWRTRLWQYVKWT